MEWCGINLTNARAVRWEKRVWRNLSALCLVFLFSGALSTWLVRQSWQISAQNRPLVEQNLHNRQALKTLEDNIALQKDSHVVPSQKIAPEKLTYFLELIQKVPLSHGGLELVHVEQNEFSTLKIVGTFAKQTEFDRLEKYLAQQAKIKRVIEHFQINSQNQIEFSLSLYLEE